MSNDRDTRKETSAAPFIEKCIAVGLNDAMDAYIYIAGKIDRAQSLAEEYKLRIDPAKLDEAGAKLLESMELCRDAFILTPEQEERATLYMRRLKANDN